MQMLFAYNRFCSLLAGKNDSSSLPRSSLPPGVLCAYRSLSDNILVPSRCQLAGSNLETLQRWPSLPSARFSRISSHTVHDSSTVRHPSADNSLINHFQHPLYPYVYVFYSNICRRLRIERRLDRTSTLILIRAFFCFEISPIRLQSD